MSQIKENCVQNGEVTLSGSLVLSKPKQSSVAVLMLHGSGPLDRDANSEGQNLDIFNAIAAALDHSGISSYRYDKRGCGKSSGDYYSAGFSDLIKDACAAVEMLAAEPCIDGVVLLGHSEGTMIAPVVAQLKPEVSGMILLCPTVQPVEDTLMRQAKYMARTVQNMPGIRGTMARLFARLRGGPPEAQRKLIARIKASGTKPLRLKRQQVPTKMLNDLFKHDLRSWIAKVQVPVLAISGAKDIQCLPSDAQLIKDLSPAPVESHCLSDLTHLLRSAQGPATFETYSALMAQDLDPRVTQLCIDWILKHDLKGP